MFRLPVPTGVPARDGMSPPCRTKPLTWIDVSAKLDLGLVARMK